MAVAFCAYLSLRVNIEKMDGTEKRGAEGAVRVQKVQGPIERGVVNQSKVSGSISFRGKYRTTTSKVQYITK